MQEEASQLPLVPASMKMPGKRSGNYVGLRSSCETAKNANKTHAWKMLFTAGHLGLGVSSMLQETAMTGKYVLARPTNSYLPRICKNFK